MKTMNVYIARLSANGGYIVLITILMLLSRPAYTEIYKWTDEAGTTHYTQTPPPAGTPASTITPPPAVDTEQARQRLESRLKSLDSRADTRHERTLNEQNASDDPAEQQRLCQQARARLASYERPRVSVPGPDGIPQRLNENERQQELQRSRELIEELC